MAASRITRKRTNASSSSKAKKFPPPSSSTKSVHEVAILKNEQKEEEEKRDERPSCDEITDPKRDGNDQSNGEALENHSIPLIHENAAAKTVDANPHLSPPKFSYKKCLRILLFNRRPRRETNGRRDTNFLLRSFHFNNNNNNNIIINNIINNNRCCR